MNTEPIRASVSEVEALIENAQLAMLQIEGFNTDPTLGFFEDPEIALGEFLNEIFEILSIVLDASGLLQTRQSLINRWELLNVRRENHH